MKLRGRGALPDEARLDAEVLLRHAAGMTRAELFSRPHELLSRDAVEEYEGLIGQRAGGRPTAYLIGRREFFGMEIFVDERVLIPRPETERLVEVVRDAVASPGACLIVEIGTGSGAVAIAAARVIPSARVVATDISAAALEVARFNAVLAGVEDRIRFVEGDTLSPLAGLGIERAAHALVSNPPYIPSGEMLGLPAEIRDHEPPLALDGGQDGLSVHRRIIAGGAGYLRPGGILALEVAAIGHQAHAVARLIEQTGDFAPPEIVRDYAGADRVVRAVRSERRADHPR
jgi:release factor glutamine methyltransferase